MKTERELTINIKTKKLKLKFREIKITIGINFWTVESIKIVQILSLLKSEKIQPWKGTLPNFTKSLIRIKFSSISLNVRLLQRLNNKNNAEAPLCTKKYFKASSNEKFLLRDIKGKKHNIFSSIQAHIIRLESLLSER